MQLRLAGPRCDAEHPGGLVMAVAIHCIENENVPCSFRQPVDRLRQVPQFATVAGVYPDRLHIGDSLDPVSLALRLTDPAEYRVDRDAVQPGCKRAVTAKLIQLVPRLDKRFLRSVLGFADVSRHPQTKSVDFVHMQPIKGLKCPRIRSLCLAYPGLLIRGCVSSGVCHPLTIVATCGGQKRFQMAFLPLS